MERTITLEIISLWELSSYLYVLRICFMDWRDNEYVNERQNMGIITERRKTMAWFPCNVGGGGLPSLVTEKKQMLVQDRIPNPAIYSLTFTEDVKYALIAFGIDDNVNDRGFLSFNGTPIFYIDKMAYGIVPVPSNKVLTGTFHYSDGGAEFLYYGALGMNRLPSDFAIRTSSNTSSSLSITLDKVYDHVVIFHAFDHGSSNSITVSVNGETLNYTVLPYKWYKYTYYGIHEMEPDSTTLNFTFSLGGSTNRLIVFAYNDY